MRLGFVAKLAAWIGVGLATNGWAAVAPVEPTQGLEKVRVKIAETQNHLIESLKVQKSARDQVRRIQQLMRLHAQEQTLLKARIESLRAFVQQLESRKVQLKARISDEWKNLRLYLKTLGQSTREWGTPRNWTQYEMIASPHRQVVGRLTERTLKKLEELRVDLADADHLESRIAHEHHEMSYLLESIREQSELLEFHKKLQADLLSEKYKERARQLEKYRDLKMAESRIEDLMKQFHSRVEYEKETENERRVTRSIWKGDFSKMRGRLSLPVSGRLVGQFGRDKDLRSGLTVFRKGVELAGTPGEPVRAIFDGKVAYVGHLPEYGKVAIIDHGSTYYSICAHLESSDVHAGQLISRGEKIGKIDSKGSPLYFEIRSGSVPVNPLQWVTN